MGYDLRRGLDGVTARAPLPHEPLSPDAVMARVRRGRLVRTTSVAGVAAVVVAGLAVAVQAAPWEQDPVPPATPSPTVSTAVPTPTPTPTPTSTPAVTSTPTAPAVPEVDPAVALTTAGDLVLLDPVTGEVVETLADDVLPDGSTSDIALTRDREAVYLGREAEGTWPGEVVRVSLADGAVEVVGTGYGPVMSPDRSTLAYIGGFEPDEYTLERRVVLLDLGTGERRTILDDDCAACERTVGSLSWSPEGSTVHVTTGYFDGPYTEEVVALDVTPGSMTPTVQDGRTVGPLDEDPQAGWREARELADGRLLVSGWQAPRDAPTSGTVGDSTDWWDDEAFLAVVDPAGGAVTDQVILPDHNLHHVSPGPDGDVALVVDRDYVSDDDGEGYRGRLLRWDVATGQVEELRDDVVSVAW